MNSSERQPAFTSGSTFDSASSESLSWNESIRNPPLPFSRSIKASRSPPVESDDIQSSFGSTSPVSVPMLAYFTSAFDVGYEEALFPQVHRREELQLVHDPHRDAMPRH